MKNRGYRFFIIRDSKCLYKKNARHVIVSVAKNGSWWFVDSDDDTMVDYHIGTERTDNHMLKSDYIKSIGEGAMKAIQDKITTNENKRYKNMNRKNTIRLTESELKKVITESVKKILKENNESFDFRKELLRITQIYLRDLKGYAEGYRDVIDDDMELNDAIYQAIESVCDLRDTLELGEPFRQGVSQGNLTFTDITGDI